MSYSVFRITDGTSAGTVDFIGGPLYIKSWAPVIPAYKGGGQYINPPIAPGRRIAFYQRDNAIERLDFAQAADDGDAGDQQLAKLVRLLDRAADHWTTNGRLPPVWLEVRNPRQANVRYAKIVSGQLTGLSNQFARPYLQEDGCEVVNPDLTVLLERRDFTTAVPGTTAALSLTGNEWLVNMLYDHSFEDAIPLGNIWQLRNSNLSAEKVATPVYHGTSSVKLTASSTGGGLKQTIDGLKASSTVTCSVWAKAESGTARLQVYDGSGYTGGSSDTTSSTTWTQLTVNKVVPSTGIINFVLELVGGTDVAYFDLAYATYVSGKSSAVTTSPLYFANGRGEYPITNVHYYDLSGTSYSSNLVGTSKPYSLLPSTVQVGDWIIFGSVGSASFSYGGPFHNILVNVTQAADIELTWYYIDRFGSSNPLNVVDNTQNFSVLGENIIQLTRDNTWGWYNLISGYVGWWVFAIVTTANSTTPPQIDVYDPFPVSENYVEIPSASLSGDNPPTVDLSITNEGAATIDPIEEFLGSGSDDGYWDLAAGGAGVLTGTSITIGQDSAALIRYPSVSVPKGAKISYARFHAVSDGGTTGPWNARLYIEQHDDAPALTTASTQPEVDRTWSPDVRDWTINGPWWNAYTGYQFNGPVVTSMVQEIVDRDGWDLGNAMCFKIQDWVVGATDNRKFKTYESEPFAWMLIIEYVDADLYTTNIVCGARSMSRGADFRSVLNLTSRQRDAVTVTVANNTAWQQMYRDGPPHADEWHPKVILSATEALAEGGVFLDRAVVTIPTDVASSYSGNFRVFVRAYNETAPIVDHTPIFRLRVSTGGESFYTQTSSLLTLETPELLDMGVISVPDYEISPENLDMLTIVLAVQMRASDATLVSLMDIVLIPVDEWAVEVGSPRAVEGAQTSGRTVQIKSVNTAGKLKTTLVNKDGKTVVWRSSGGKLTPPLDETTRLYFVTSTDETIGGIDSGAYQQSEKASWANLVYSLEAEFVNSYLLYAGAL